MGDPTKPISATKKFTAIDNKTEMKEILSSVYNALVIKGYNPINQLVGYILSEDPTYITNYNSARSMITRLDRDELLRECSLFDVYTGAPIPEGQKSVSFSLKMRADDQTLTDEHAEEIVNAVLEALKNAYHAVMR